MTVRTDVAELKRELEDRVRRRRAALARKKRLRRELKAPVSDIDPGDASRPAWIAFVGLLAFWLVAFLSSPRSSFGDEAEQLMNERIQERQKAIAVAKEGVARLKRESEGAGPSEPSSVENRAGAFPCLAKELKSTPSREALLAARWANVSIAACKTNETGLATVAFRKLTELLRRSDDSLTNRLAETTSTRCHELGVQIESLLEAAEKPQLQQPER